MAVLPGTSAYCSNNRLDILWWVIYAGESSPAARGGGAANGGVGEVQNVMAQNMAMMQETNEKLHRLDNRAQQLQKVRWCHYWQHHQLEHMQ